MAAPHLVVLERSEAFAELWPRLAATMGATLRLGRTVAELGDLADAVAVIVAAGGVEQEVHGEMEGLRARRDLRLCVVGASPDHRLAISLLHAGADDYFAMPGELSALRSWVVAQADRVATAAKVRALATEHRKRYNFSQMIGRGAALLDTLERAAKIIPNRSATVLIQGETGTGKELLARAIHYNGPRGERPFVELNCAALPESLLESELFGYAAGAFTDARTSKPGLMEVASGGTLFLDEIGDMSLALQGKLLRVLEDKRVRRVGSVNTLEVDTRVIAATHVDVEQAVREGRFRQDLFYRLNIFRLFLPPLRERQDDVLLLARHFLDRFSDEYGYPRSDIPPDVVRALLYHGWPGNVRELRNAVERAVVLGDGVLATEHLFVAERRETPPPRGALPFPATLRAIEQAAARSMVDYYEGNKTRAADALGISRKFLYELINVRGASDPGPR